MIFGNKRVDMAKSTIILLLFYTVLMAQDETPVYPGPEITGLFGNIPGKFESFHVVLQPDKDAAEWWAGAPSVVVDGNGTFWLACRMRTADAPRGLRGYEIRILRSDDGIHFKKALAIHRTDVPIPGFERPALLLDAVSRRFKLYACGPWQEKAWSIIKFDDADEPTEFIAATAKPVIQPQPQRWPRDIRVTGFKDPFIVHANDAYHCFVIGYIRRNERIFHFSSRDGEIWQPVGEPNTSIMPLAGWHDFFVRPASVLPIGAGYLFIYEGSGSSWYDPVYNVVTGMGFTFDLHRIMDLTPDSPLVISTTPGHFYTWRYSHWMWVDGQIWIYAEVAGENDANEIRLFRLDLK
jgi:hypothetical protein